MFINGGLETTYFEDKSKHNKNSELGSKKIVYGKKNLIDEKDVRNFAEDEEMTLMNGGNAIVRKVHGAMNRSKKVVTATFKKTNKKSRGWPKSKTSCRLINFY